MDYEKKENDNLYLKKTIRKDNKSGFPGVCYEPRCNKWRAYINIGKYKKSLGYFSDINAAIEARKKAEIERKKAN